MMGACVCSSSPVACKCVGKSVQTRVYNMLPRRKDLKLVL